MDELDDYNERNPFKSLLRRHSTIEEEGNGLHEKKCNQQNISEQKLKIAEQKLKISEQKLKISEQRLQIKEQRKKISDQREKEKQIKIRRKASLTSTTLTSSLFSPAVPSSRRRLSTPLLSASNRPRPTLQRQTSLPPPNQLSKSSSAQNTPSLSMRGNMPEKKGGNTSPAGTKPPIFARRNSSPAGNTPGMWGPSLFSCDASKKTATHLVGMSSCGSKKTGYGKMPAGWGVSGNVCAYRSFSTVGRKNKRK